MRNFILNATADSYVNVDCGICADRRTVVAAATMAGGEGGVRALRSVSRGSTACRPSHAGTAYRPSQQQTAPWSTSQRGSRDSMSKRALEATRLPQRKRLLAKERPCATGSAASLRRRLHLSGAGHRLLALSRS